MITRCRITCNTKKDLRRLAIKGITIDAQEYRMSESDYERLMERFDADKATVNAFGYFAIHVDLICVDRWRKCIKCPLFNPSKRTNSCIDLFKRIAGDQFFQHLYFFDHGIFWNPEYDEEARQALQKIKNVLSAAAMIQ